MRPAAAVLLLLGLAARAGAAPLAERGDPLLRVFSAEEYAAGVQNFSLAQDGEGVLWVGNLAGVLSYDGVRWSTRALPNGSAVLAVATDTAGRVAVGAIGELGRLAPDGRGEIRYASLLPRLAQADRDVGEVRSIVRAGAGLVFAGERRLVLWTGDAVRVIARFESGADPRAFAVGRDVFVRASGRLWRLAGERLEPLAADPGGVVDVLLDGPVPGTLLAAVRGQGLRVLRAGAPGLPFAPAASAWLAAREVTGGCVLPDGRWAFAGRHGGILIVERDGSGARVLDETTGLPDDGVRAVLSDGEGGLWAALDSGLARVDLASPLSVIDARLGLRGLVAAVCRHRGVLWVATSAGAYTLDGDRAKDGLVARRVEGIPGPAWDVLSASGDALVSTPAGVFRAGSAAPAPIAGTEAVHPYVLASREGSDREVLVGTREGLGVLRREDAGWRFVGLVPGTPRYVRRIEERPAGVLWCGTIFEGVARVELARGAPLESAQVRRLGQGEMAVHATRDRLLVAAGSEVLLIDEARGVIRPDRALDGVGGRGVVFRLEEDARGNLWTNTQPPAMVPRRADGSYDVARRTLVPLPARSAQSLDAEPDGTVWLGTERGLFRFAGEPGPETAPPRASIRRVSLLGGALLFGGAGAPPDVTLPHAFRRIRVDFAPGSFRPGIAYQYRLSPGDEGWSPWSADGFTEYTNLAGGRYTLEVRAADAAGRAGPVAAWSFAVEAPWQRSPWTWATAALLALAIAGGVARFRNAALRRQARHLQALVDERTQALQEANARLVTLTLHDELTGIANRRQLQQALDEEWARARRLGAPLAFVLADIDLFKSLNDARGHHEGDRCLREVAQALRASLPRSGDLAARYGGEEFAILLPATDEEGALRVAERLRAAVQALGLPHAGSPTGVITASFGVASRLPDPGEDREVLVEAADRALYRAKADGRNCVRGGGPASAS